MFLRTKKPNPIPMNVAIEIPKIPASTPGTTKELHPLAVAIAHAVVGPPTLAFEPISNNFLSIPRNFPIPRVIERWTMTWTKANKNISGAFVIASEMFPLAPTTEKKTYSYGSTYKEQNNQNQSYYRFS